MGDVLRPPVSPAKLVEGAFYRERGRVDRVKRVRRMGAGTRKGLKRASRCRTWLSWEMDGEGERGKVAKVEDRDDGWLARCARVGLSGPPEGEPGGGRPQARQGSRCQPLLAHGCSVSGEAA